MIQTFIYHTEIGNREFQHTIHARDIESSLAKWIDQLESLKGQVYSFDLKLVDKIRKEFDLEKIDLTVNETATQLLYSVDGTLQITYINKVEKGPPDFIADLTYLKTEDGGRRGYAASGYRPHFQIEGRKEMTSAEQLFVDKDKVFPGESVTAEIRILCKEGFEGSLYRGMKFKLGEGNRIVAEGKITDLINENLKKPAANTR